MIDISGSEFLKLDYEGVRTLVMWAAAEGWNPGLDDAELFYSTDPDGFYGYFSGQEMIAGGSIVSYQGNFGFMGFFIVKPEFRAQGIGRKLWYLRRDALLSRLNQGAGIGMDGVVDMQAFYQKGGFEIAFRDERHLTKAQSFAVHPGITEIRDEDLHAITAYDIRCFGFPRPQFLLPWLKQAGAKALQYRANGELMGYAVSRKAISGYKIGPLFADNPAIAEELYKACLDSAHGGDVSLDIPMDNPDAIALVKKYQSTYVFECARMYYGNKPHLPINKIFGLTSFELG